MLIYSLMCLMCTKKRFQAFCFSRPFIVFFLDVVILPLTTQIPVHITTSQWIIFGYSLHLSKRTWYWKNFPSSSVESILNMSPSETVDNSVRKSWNKHKTLVIYNQVELNRLNSFCNATAFNILRFYALKIFKKLYLGAIYFVQHIGLSIT